MEEMAQLSEELARLRGTLSRLESSRSTNSANININAGGPALWFAVWFCSLACAVMLTVAFLSRENLVDDSRKIDIANDKLSIILQWAPQLKEIINKQLEHEHKDKT